MARKQQAFTLIELMVVVAIIAILATLSVSNFSTAIRRTRNTQRVSDIQAVVKAMETCYDAMTGRYSGFAKSGDPGFGGIGTEQTVKSDDTDAPAGSIFSKGTVKCLNEDIIPGVETFDYTGAVITEGGVQSFYACAQLEQVDGWENVGNNSSGTVTHSNTGGQITWTLDTCGDGSAADACFFCGVGSQ